MQKKRKLGEEKRQATRVEANNLLTTGFLKEEMYTTWFSMLSWLKRRAKAGV